MRIQGSVSLLTAITMLLLVAGVALGADHTPVPTPILIDPLDPRAGAGASLVGSPLLALLVVIGIGLLAALLSYAYVRLLVRR